MCVTPVDEGEPCSPQDCLTNSVCASGTSCVYGDVGGGLGWRCRGSSEGGKILLSLCDPDAPGDDGCPHDTFCRDDRQCNPQVTWDGLCADGSWQGLHCDSDWGAAACAPCVPGSHCVDSALGSYCHRRCESDADCPCEPSDPLGCVGGLCYQCAAFSEACDPERKCCDANTACSLSGVCCSTELGHACSSPAQCCEQAGLTCFSTSGTCQQCLEPGKTGCFESTDCCGKAECKGGLCAVPCNEGEPCDTGEPGICANGITYCTPQGPQCIQAVDKGPEICDGLDNDCNGQADDSPVDLGQCPPTHPADCKANMSLQVTTTETCVGGEKVCEPVGGQDYCDGCEQTVGGQSCGPCASHACTPEGYCAPGEYCNSLTNKCIDDDAYCAPYLCWMPSDLKAVFGKGGWNCGP